MLATGKAYALQRSCALPRARDTPSDVGPMARMSSGVCVRPLQGVMVTPKVAEGSPAGTARITTEAGIAAV